MHKIALLSFFFLLGMKTYSQQQYFVYIQADDRQPFYVRMDEKIYSSTESGYLILSKLSERKYDFFLGFARNAFPEQAFSLTVNNRDKGYQLKNFGGKGWGLVDLQNQDIVMNTTFLSGSADLTGEKKTDPFSIMLASVVNDSAILYTQVKVKTPDPVIEAKQEEKATVSAEKIPEPGKQTNETTASSAPAGDQPVATTTAETELKAKTNGDKSIDEPVRQDSVAGKTAVAATETHTVAVKEKNEASTVAAVTLEKPFISRIKEVKNAEGYHAVYLEQYNYSTDTIDISIPLDNIELTVKKEQPAVVPEIKQQEEVISANKPAAKNDAGHSEVLEKGSISDTVAVKKKTIVMVNSDCKNFATDHDVDKLRVKILNEKTIDNKLAAARKYFKNRCFTVKQLNALTELFPTDETKYRFLDLAYAFASDSGNYYQLENAMGEDYYKNRFRAMIRK